LAKSSSPNPDGGSMRRCPALIHNARSWFPDRSPRAHRALGRKRPRGLPWPVVMSLTTRTLGGVAARLVFARRRTIRVAQHKTLHDSKDPERQHVGCSRNLWGHVERSVITSRSVRVVRAGFAMSGADG